MDALFGGWSNLGHVAVGGTAAYATLIVFLRLSGKRTLAKLNAFDLVISVALGSILAAVVLPARPSLVDGVLALALMIALQFAVAWFQVRSSGVRAWVKNQPTFLVRHGVILEKNLRRERISLDELLSALRNSGCGDIAEVAGAVLETDGSISVVRARPEVPEKPTLADVSDGR